MKLNPQRLYGESYSEYCKRRKKENKAIEEHLKGRVIWQSSKIITLPRMMLQVAYAVPFMGTYCTDPIKRQKMGWKSP